MTRRGQSESFQGQLSLGWGWMGLNLGSRPEGCNQFELGFRGLTKVCLLGRMGT